MYTVYFLSSIEYYLWLYLASSFPSGEVLSREVWLISRMTRGFVFSSKPYFENERDMNWDCTR